MPLAEHADILSRRQRNYEKFQKDKEFYETKDCTFKPKIKKYFSKSTTRRPSLSKSMTADNLRQDLNETIYSKRSATQRRTKRASLSKSVFVDKKDLNHSFINNALAAIEHDSKIQSWKRKYDARIQRLSMNSIKHDQNEPFKTKKAPSSAVRS
jgi:hypothetical protein